VAGSEPTYLGTIALSTAASVSAPFVLIRLSNPTYPTRSDSRGEFASYKRLALYLPNIREVSDLTDLKDTIRTRRSEPAHGRKKAVAAQFDTALAYKALLPKGLEGWTVC
jgi:hypothetical protein